MFKLVIQDDEGKTTVVPLIRDEITIGRKEGNTIRLTERNVSRRHARIVRSNGEVQIEDLGSYNGIRVNNARIAERVSLRVSDQVQIGDYKLYLKAEGVEQVDDARTMPIERVDSAAPTDVHAAVAPAPTAPMPAQAPPAAPQMVGNPNRTMVAIADTDPQGRPVASPAQIDALTKTMGYGKLVVLSSNFAGKEFELSRPQMIIGRTDENDIVINHRSISRNHAKLVREPETGRYTISDLQSSNGVRVNGQDYGKVELRRGDVVDLGHVRLRFIEPGEDFVFTRDAVITDVPDAGSKRSLLVAIVIALVIAGGVVVFIAMRGGDKGDNNATGPTGSNDGSNQQVVATTTPDAPVQQGVEAPADATQAAVVPPPKDTDDPKLQCLQAKADKKWQDLQDCAKKLQATDKKLATEYSELAASEQRAIINVGKIKDAITAQSLHDAKQFYDSIPETSSSKGDAKQIYEPYEKSVHDKIVGKAKDYLAQHKCNDLKTFIGQAKGYSDAIEAEVKGISGRCVPEVAVGDPQHKNPKDNPVKDPNPKEPKNTDPANTGSGSGATATKDPKTTPPPKDCDVENLRTKGTEFVNMGQYGAALAKFKEAMKCPGGNSLAIVRLAFLAACQAGDAASARSLFALIPPTQQNGVQQICMRNHIDPAKP
jgi:pSer/pThr/pTyr-binding forkhead associated (FHA) protein